MLRRAAAHKGAAFVEVFQNCNIYNDGEFDYIREDKDARTYLAARRGVRVNRHRPRRDRLRDGVRARAAGLGEERRDPAGRVPRRRARLVRRARAGAARRTPRATGICRHSSAPATPGRSASAVVAPLPGLRALVRDATYASALRARLDHVASLGVDAVWLSPIHPSPNVDWGYDVADYRDVHPDYGTLADYDALIAAAREKNIDVWLDLVPNHTSDRHALVRATSPEYYVWSKEIPNDWKSIFTGESAWQYDASRKQYYLHQFAVEQPDLDWWNPDVRDEFERILRFWFDRGVRGLRIDVAHGLIKDKLLRSGEQYLRNRPEVHEIYARWQAIARRVRPEADPDGRDVRRAPTSSRPTGSELDLAQNAAFIHARVHDRRAAPDRRADDGGDPGRTGSRSGSARTTTTRAWRRAGPAATSTSTRPRSS